MSTAVKTAAPKFACQSCTKEFTKKTLDENGGICGRCANKKADTNNDVVTFPATNNVTQFVLPGTELKLMNLSINESNLASSLTVKSRLDIWCNSKINGKEKNDAAVAYVKSFVSTNIKEQEKIPGVNNLNLEHLFNFMHKMISE